METYTNAFFFLIQSASITHCVCANYLHHKGGYVFGSVGLFICLPGSVCLFVKTITHKVINRLL